MAEGGMAGIVVIHFFPLLLLHSGQCEMLNPPLLSRLISFIIASHRNGPANTHHHDPSAALSALLLPPLCWGSANVGWLLRFRSLFYHTHTHAHIHACTASVMLPLTLHYTLSQFPLSPPVSTADVRQGHALCLFLPGWCLWLVYFCVGFTLIRSITLMD